MSAHPKSRKARERRRKALERKRARAFYAKRAETRFFAGEIPPEPRRGALYWWTAIAGFSLFAAAGYLIDRFLLK